MKAFLIVFALLLYCLQTSCQAPPDGCEVILDGACFRYFQDNAGVTWLQAQNDCVARDFNLTTIRNSQEDGLVLSIIPAALVDCWIGLNDRDTEDTYVWVDGSTSTYRRYDINQPDNAVVTGGVVEGEDCFQTKFGGPDAWNDDYCENTERCYICGATIAQFGVINPGTAIHSPLNNNAIIFSEQDLFCVTESGAAEIAWTFTTSSSDPNPETLTATSWSPVQGVSTVNSSREGFYRCRVRQNVVDMVFFTAGVFDAAQTTRVEENTVYNYTVGVDRENIRILCDLSRSDVPLENIRWRDGSDSFTNPLNIFTNRDLLFQNNLAELTCINIPNPAQELLTTSIRIQGPPTITVAYPGIQTQVHSQIAPRLNSVALPLPSQRLTISTNLIRGRWRLPDNTFISQSTLFIDQIMEDYNETFGYYVINWDGVEVLAIQIRITTTEIFTNCDAIYGGSCITLTSNTQLSWSEAEQNCVLWGGHLTSIESVTESNILTSIEGSSNRECWIGLNDINDEAGADETAFTWVDGSNSVYREFINGEPTNNDSDEDFVYFRTNISSRGWLNANSTRTNNCYFCKRPTSIFGQAISDTTYSALEDNILLTQSTNLVCVNENNQTTTWTYREGSLSVGTDVTNLATRPGIGLSQLTVSISSPGYYSCEVKISGVPVTFTTGVFDLNEVTVADSTIIYNYLIGVDDVDTKLFFDVSLQPDIPLKDIIWRRNQGANLSNPLNIFENRNELTNSPDPTLHCINIVNGDILLTTTVFIQDPPTITVSYPGLRTLVHNQIAPRMNSVALPLPPQMLTITSNVLQGRWRLSNNTYLPVSTLIIDQITENYDEVFEFHVINWENDEVLAIQIRFTTTGITSDCDAIYAASCLTFTSSPQQLTWLQAELDCVTLGGHLASIESEAESDILTNIAGAMNRECWIGLNDINVDAGTDSSEFNWVDGAESVYRNFIVGQPTSNTPAEDVVYFRTNRSDMGWVNAATSRTNDCYFCKRPTSLFGQALPNNVYIVLSNNMIVSSEINLICINENLTTTWSFNAVSLPNAVDLTSVATQPSIGLSQLIANPSQPGFYTCEIRNGGVPIRFTTGVFDPNRIRVAEPANYEYIVGVDPVEANLFCNSSLEPNIGLQDIVWRRQQCVNLPNPLNILANREELTNLQNGTLSCVNSVDDRVILITNLDVLGPPIVMLSNDEVSEQHLMLPPAVNRISLDVLTPYIVGVNIENGEWETVNGRIPFENNFLDNFLIPLARLEDSGLYEYYTERNWDNQRKLVISVDIQVLVPYIQRITRITSTILNETSVQIDWELAETPRSDSNETFYISLQISDTVELQGITSSTSFTLTNLTPNLPATVIIELEYAYSSVRTRNTTQINSSSSRINLNESLLTILLPIAFILLLFSFIICILLLCLCMWSYRRRRKNVTLAPLTIGNEANALPNIQLNSLAVKNNIDSHHASDIEEGIVISHFVQDMDTKAGQTYYNIPSSFSGNNISSPHDVTGDYQTIDDYMDPLMKPIQLDYYKTHLDKIWANAGSLEREYDALGDKGHRCPSDHAMVEGNRKKNRFKQIYPYDRSRVELRKIGSDDNSDYINASHIAGYYVPNCFIAAQAPKDNTLIDFWRMITENEIVNIVMVSKLFEDGRRKCEQYFPTSGKEHLQFGSFNITLREEVNHVDYSIRTIHVTDGDRNSEIKHFHFTAWPDHDVPILFNGVIHFIHEVHEGLYTTRAPILVHCSAGVGRTGTFITLFNLMPTIQHGLPISIYRVVHEMRECRPQMVQTFRQYKFIYLAVLELIFGNTSIPTKSYIDTYKTYLTTDSEGYISTFFEQFTELNYQCEKSFEYLCNVGKYPGNATRNIDSQTIPCDSSRVILHSNHFETEYINATCLDKSRIIIGMHPTIYTSRDFYQMIYQYEPGLIIMLTTPDEKKLIEASEKNQVQYWPTSAGPVNNDPFQLTMNTCETSGAIDKKTITLKHLNEDQIHSFQQIISPYWSDQGEPTDLCSIVRLLKMLIVFKNEQPNATIIIHSVSGTKQTDIFYTAFKAIEISTWKDEINIFQIVKELRSVRMNSMPELNHFLACYALVNEYFCDTAV